MDLDIAEFLFFLCLLFSSWMYVRCHVSCSVIADGDHWHDNRHSCWLPHQYGSLSQFWGGCTELMCARSVHLGRRQGEDWEEHVLGHDSALSSQKLAFLGSLANGKSPRLVLICPKSDSKIPQSFQVSSDCKDMLGLVLVTRGHVLREGIYNPRI